ncbi:hypothetical protein [Embleya sp. NPDC059237]|uniref:hypothetical protein n=1 Tax=Embleya sp. NPDC059237 TaxID=3346784 RepID=UPI0036A688E5
MQFAFLGWDALDTHPWVGAATLPPAELDDLLAAYATCVTAPDRGAAVVCQRR